MALPEQRQEFEDDEPRQRNTVLCKVIAGINYLKFVGDRGQTLEIMIIIIVIPGSSSDVVYSEVVDFSFYNCILHQY